MKAYNGCRLSLKQKPECVKESGKKLVDARSKTAICDEMISDHYVERFPCCHGGRNYLSVPGRRPLCLRNIVRSGLDVLTGSF